MVDLDKSVFSHRVNVILGGRCARVRCVRAHREASQPPHGHPARLEQKENPISKFKARKAFTLTLLDGGGEGERKGGGKPLKAKASKSDKKGAQGSETAPDAMGNRSTKNGNKVGRWGAAIALQRTALARTHSSCIGKHRGSAPGEVL